MSYYIKRAAKVSGVPTDGTVYYKGDNRWSNVFEDRKTYSDEESAVQDITTTTYLGHTYRLKNCLIVSE